jgi:hypothetical protein
MKMKKIKNYNSFLEQYKLNEGNIITNTLDKIYKFFKNKFKKVAWLYYMLYLEKTGQLSKLGIKLYVPYSVNDIPAKNIETELENESLKFKISRKPFFLNEANVDLKSSDPNKPDVDADKLREALLDIHAENEDRIEHNLKRADNSSTLFIWGAPGIGKTAIVNQVAKELDMVVEVMLLSQYSPEDFKGVPKIVNIEGSNDPEDERTVFRLPKTFPKDNCPNGKGGFLFFDEMNQANKFVLGAAMTLCLDGTVGKYKLPEHWIIIAAGNRKEDVGEGGLIVPLSKPLAGRFSHINYAPTKDNFILHVVNKEDMNPDVMSFIEFMPDWLFKIDSDEESDLYPSPRSWVSASHSDYIKRGRNWKNKISYNDILLVYGKKVGIAAAAAFVAYLKLKVEYDEKDVADVYKKGAKAKKLPSRTDLARAAAVSIGLFKKSGEMTIEEVKNVYEFALNQPDFEATTSLLNYFHWIHPYLKTDPKYKAVAWENIKKWHEKEKKDK